MMMIKTEKIGLGAVTVIQPRTLFSAYVSEVLAHSEKCCTIFGLFSILFIVARHKNF